MELQANLHVFEEPRRCSVYLPVFPGLLYLACPHHSSGDGRNLPRPNPCLAFGKGQGAGFLDRFHSSLLKSPHTIQERCFELACFIERYPCCQNGQVLIPEAFVRLCYGQAFSPAPVQLSVLAKRE